MSSAIVAHFFKALLHPELAAVVFGLRIHVVTMVGDVKLSQAFFSPAVLSRELLQPSIVIWVVTPGSRIRG
jgi:hypothetical protein